MSQVPLRVIVADDEPPARDRLRRLLRAEKNLDLVGEAGDGPAAVSLIREHRPHIALLDIRLPGLNGFEVLERLRPQPPPAVIFVTAFREHTIQAFEAQAVDYLLKPFSVERFREALKRARLHCGSVPAPSLPIATDGRRIAVRCGVRRVLLACDDILYATAANACCEVFTATCSWKIAESLGSLEKRLPADRFVRISRFDVVNVAHVAALEPKSHGDQHLVLRNRQRLTVSRTRREEVIASLNGR